MPRALLANHASASDLSERQSRVRDDDGASDQPRRPHTALGNPDMQASEEEDVVPEDGRAVDKRTLDFVWRSGVAGGLAGCAVSYLSSST
jgi:hypothetical protein